MKISIIILQLFFLILLNITQNIDSRLMEDEPDTPFMNWLRRNIIRPLQNTQDIEAKKHCGKMQTILPKSVPFSCDAKNGPGKRSSVRPTSIHKLRPGDIDIVAAIGDSLTGGNGVAGTNILDIAVENRGMVFSIGGQATWRKYTTLPNMLKLFNPNLYGYSLGNSLSIDRKSKFNVAEGGAKSHDTLYQAKVLRNRLIHDPKVNMTQDWKLLTIFMGGIDICRFFCVNYDLKTLLGEHENDYLKALRFLRDNVPRLMVNIVLPVSGLSLYSTNQTYVCHTAFETICPCYLIKSKVDYVERARMEWYKVDEKIANLDEFHTNEFTVNVIPFGKNVVVPVLKNNVLDQRYFSMDCTHFSQKLHRVVSIAYWNNLFERNGEKTETANVKMKINMCPTEDRPYIATRENSRY